MTGHINSKWLNISLWIIFLIALVVTAVLGYRHQTFKHQIYESSKDELHSLTIGASRQIDAILQQAMSSAQSLAAGLTDGRIHQNNMLVNLQSMLRSNPNYYGGTITFAPYSLDKRRRLYSAYYYKSGDGDALTFQQLDQIYDYTTPEYDWYVEPMSQGNRWGEPYWDEAGKTYLTTYSARFYTRDPVTQQQIPSGVVTIDISMKQIRNIVESLNIGASGFGALTTLEGNYLYHPNYDYVLLHKNLRDVAREKNDKDRLKVAELAAQRKGGIIEHISTTTGRASWLIFEPVPTSGWSLQNTYIQDDLHIDVDALRQQMIWIVVAVLVLLISLSAIVLNVLHGEVARIWAFSGLISVFLFFSIGITWSLALGYHNSSMDSGTRIVDKTKLESVMETYNQRNASKHLATPIYIPTGINIETVDLLGSSDISVTGTIWQKYPKNFPSELEQGFQIGQALNVKIEKIGVHTSAKALVSRWRFQANLRSKLDYSRYPLEVEKIRIKILPLSTADNVVFIPDLDAYKLLTATLKPGLEEGVFIQGWELTESYFLFKNSNLLTNFGVDNNFDQEQFPDLYYVVGMKRIFVDAFISNLTPLIVVTIILFTIALLPTNIDIGKVLGICVSVFFVVVFSHLAIRRNISIGEIFYLEYFFFVIYFAILLVPMNAFRVSLGISSWFFEYRNALIPKAIYWPTIMGIFFVITAWKFY